MEVNQLRANAAKVCFDFNTNLNKVHVTSDCKCFPTENHAIGHARTLVDKSIDVFERDGEDVEFDEFDSEDLTDEAENIPDHLLATTKRQTGEQATDFKKVEKPEIVQPVENDTPPLSTDVPGANQPAITNQPETIEPIAAEPETHKPTIMETINQVIESAEHVIGADVNPDQSSQQ